MATLYIAWMQGYRDEHAELGTLAAQTLVRRYRCVYTARQAMHKPHTSVDILTFAMAALSSSLSIGPHRREQAEDKLPYVKALLKSQDLKIK